MWERDKERAFARVAEEHQIDASYNSRFPKPTKPAKTFVEFHKKRRKPSKAQIVEKAKQYLKWKEASDAFNTEEATPLDI